jgi:hypothetical protein
MENTHRAPFASERPWVLVPAAVVAASVIVTGQAGRADLLPRVGAYVDAWERELGSVVADETYQQPVGCNTRSVRLVDGKGVLAPGPSLADLMKDERRCQHISRARRWRRASR